MHCTLEYTMTQNIYNNFDYKVGTNDNNDNEKLPKRPTKAGGKLGGGGSYF